MLEHRILRKKKTQPINNSISINVVTRGYSSVVEHSTADREVPGSNPGAPCFLFLVIIVFIFYLNFVMLFQASCRLTLRVMLNISLIVMVR